MISTGPYRQRRGRRSNGRILASPNDGGYSRLCSSALRPSTSIGILFAGPGLTLWIFLRYVLEHQDEIVTACCLDSGKTKVDASFGESLVTAEKLKWTIDHGEKALAPESRPTNFLMMYKKNKVTYEPLGVVSACVSWNYPFHNFISPVISAIFAGNGIVVKPSEQTAWSSAYILDIIRGALESCGHSRDLVQSVVCLPKVADVLTSHSDISQITFIGSRPVAHKVCESAAKALTPVTVELGGKDPAVILDDSRTVNEVPSIASVLMRGVFQSAGQNCIGVERVIALPGVYDKLLDIVSSRIKTLRLGSILLDTTPNPNDPHQKPRAPDVGAMISPASFDRLESLITDAVSQGARLIVGGKRFNHPTHTLGHYFAPTLLADVTPTMAIAQTELFAPVFLMMRATSVVDAISIANSTEYGLGASVFGYNPADVDACVRGIKSGMVSVNDFGSYYAVQLPFGGVKGSGYGRFAGEEGLRGVSNIKAVCVDRFPKLMATRIPPRVDYPIYKGESGRENGQGAWEMCKGVVETGYQITLGGRVRGIARLLGNM
ncbi:Aldehyde/histidinol dehydrogenase [Aspergillus lucknowensis]|uniref:aldehyde dehydrogenase (NAD(+)) n=1 Tax=Aspergillus lucknowensis TaxID=176173 RepID=A0ABR4M453_9EURO